MDSASNGGVVSMDTRFVVGGDVIYTANSCVTDASSMDANGNMCSWYASRPAMCGFFDVTTTFVSETICCECGGGTVATDQSTDAVASADGDANDNYMVTTTGAVVLDGMAGDDVLEDHNAEAFLAGGAGDDKLISRNGRDALWGGNSFGLTDCIDSITSETDSAGRTTCSYYEANPQMCGNFDITPGAAFIASQLCCICGGGTSMTLYEVAGANGASTFDATNGEIDSLGDADKYVIYPTTEKGLYFEAYTDTFPSNGNLRNRNNECTKVFGFTRPDTL